MTFLNFTLSPSRLSPSAFASSVLTYPCTSIWSAFTSATSPRRVTFIHHSHPVLHRCRPFRFTSPQATATSSTTQSTDNDANIYNNSSGTITNSYGDPSTPSTTTIRSNAKKEAPLLRFAKSLIVHWRLLIPALIGGVVASICAVLEPTQFGKILSILSNMHHARIASAPATLISKHKTRLFFQILTIAITYLIEMASTALFISCAARTADRAIRNLRQDLFKATLSNDITFFDKTGRDNIEKSAALQLRIARQSFWDNLSEDRGLRAILEALFGMMMCLHLTGPIGIPIFCIIIPILALSVARLGLKSGRLNAKVESKEADFQIFLNERIRGIQTLKAFGGERKEFNDLKSLLNVAQKTIIEFIDMKSVTTCANRLNIYITAISFFFFGGHFVSVGKMTFETFSSLIGFIWVLNFAIHGLLFTFTDTAKASVALGNVYDILDDASFYRQLQEKHQCPSTDFPNSFKGLVSFKNVSFSYPSRPDSLILQDISFDMYPGQMIALVGESGGGKSTVAGLLCRFYRPSSGEISMDGLDIQCIPNDIYARQLSVVDQEPFLFQGTIRDNIAYGLPDDIVSDEQVIQAAKEANAHLFITQLSNGYETQWSPGSNLSGGQRQRIAIARSLVKCPRVLVLDEATSALDSESERAVQVALEKIMKNRTTLIIAHRLSTVRSADVILFIKGGLIVERGTFNELYALDNLFKSLVDSSSAFNLSPSEGSPSEGSPAER